MSDASATNDQARRTTGLADTARQERQKAVAARVHEVLDSETMARAGERAARMLKKAAGLARSLGVPRQTANAIIGEVFEKPASDPAREAGGVGISLLACCDAAGVSADDEEARELQRVLAQPRGATERPDQGRSIRSWDVVSSIVTLPAFAFGVFCIMAVSVYLAVSSDRGSWQSLYWWSLLLLATVVICVEFVGERRRRVNRTDNIA